jgi:hypothetical protein
MVTCIMMAIGALGVGLLAGLTGAMPSPQALRSQSDETWPPEPEMDTPTESPVGVTLPQLPREILDALAEAQRLGRAMPIRLHDDNDARGPVPGEFEDEPTA